MSLSAPKTLQQLEVPLISRETCNCLYNIDSNPEEPHTIQQDMVCAGYVTGGKDACQVNTGARRAEHTAWSGGWMGLTRGLSWVLAVVLLFSSG